jgi:hypothetical protein
MYVVPRYDPVFVEPNLKEYETQVKFFNKKQSFLIKFIYESMNKNKTTKKNISISF